MTSTEAQFEHMYRSGVLMKVIAHDLGLSPSAAQRMRVKLIPEARARQRRAKPGRTIHLYVDDQTMLRVTNGAKASHMTKTQYVAKCIQTQARVDFDAVVAAKAEALRKKKSEWYHGKKDGEISLGR